MRTLLRSMGICGLLLVLSGAAVCDDAVPDDQIRESVQRALPLLQTASAGSAEHRECFTCHHQALPVLAFTAAQRSGFDVDKDNLNRQIQHTMTHLQRGYEDYLQGKGQGGQALTAGYALWALQAAEWTPDETTEAVAHYLIKRQNGLVHWRQSDSRPPSSGSDFTATFVAAKALTDWTSTDEQPAAESRRKRVAEWLLKTAAVDTEDHVFRLLALHEFGADTAVIESARTALQQLQREDGGWAQLPEMTSDAYATGSALYALLTTRNVTRDDTAARRGIRFLLDTQQPDGTWHVVTRADGFQTYFESGFPYEEDQFISTAASSWAVLALIHALPAANLTAADGEEPGEIPSVRTVVPAEAHQ